MKKVSLTGDRPTGPLHLGHYFGSLLSRKELEKEFDSFIMVADVQGLTDNFNNPQKVRDNVYEVTIDNLAVGMNPEETTFFIQSQIPQIAELTVFYSNLVTINTLKRNPTVKSEIAEKEALFGKDGESLTYGFLGYPVSQAADITFCRANIVPVGEDQLPMIEQTREIVEKFHRIYNTDIFPLPQAKLSVAPRIAGLDGNAKMSKSLNNCIFLKDTAEETIEKIKTAKTDSESTISFDKENRPEISNLILIYSLASGITTEEAVSDLKDITYGPFKEKLAESINSHLAELRERRIEIASKPEYVKEVLEKGRIKATQRAEETMKLVRGAMRIDY